jgi:hypothetical protein
MTTTTSQKRKDQYPGRHAQCAEKTTGAHKVLSGYLRSPQRENVPTARQQSQPLTGTADHEEVRLA